MLNEMQNGLRSDQWSSKDGSCLQLAKMSLESVCQMKLAVNYESGLPTVRIEIKLNIVSVYLNLNFLGMKKNSPQTLTTTFVLSEAVWRSGNPRAAGSSQPIDCETLKCKTTTEVEAENRKLRLNSLLKPNLFNERLTNRTLRYKWKCICSTVSVTTHCKFRMRSLLQLFNIK